MANTAPYRMSSLSPSDYAELERRVRMDGGSHLGQTCRAKAVELEPVADVPRSDEVSQKAGPEAAQNAPMKARLGSTGCGRQRMLEVPYESFIDGTLHHVKVCADDDGVAYWPRFTGQREPV